MTHLNHVHYYVFNAIRSKQHHKVQVRCFLTWLCFIVHKSNFSRSSCVNGRPRQSAERLFVLLHASCLLSFLAFVAQTFVCVSLCVMASCVFSGTEDSYTVTCGMPLPCMADAQKNNSGLHCIGKYKTSRMHIHLTTRCCTLTLEHMCFSMFSVQM